MKTPFGKDLYQLDEEFLREAYELEQTGSITLDLGPGAHRVKLTNNERTAYIAALTAYDEFLGLYRVHDDPDLALSKISDSAVRLRVREYNDWAVSVNQSDTRYYFAAFLGGHLEALLTGGIDERYEVAE